jgi:hypothetical protein
VSTTTERLYNLLPAVYRLRDAERGEPLRALLAVIAEQVDALEENLAQLYDDEFIETCAEWVVPYMGDLIGYRALNGVVPTISSPRAEVAHTIAYRRRKGTASVLEQLARDVTGWDARVVEFFQLLATTQYMNHIRPRAIVTPDLRKWEPLARLNTAFETTAHTLDVRNISSQRGKYNIPNIGIFLFRLRAYSLTNAPAFQLDAQRFLFSPLGNHIPLFHRPETETEITSLATPQNVPLPISRRVLHETLCSTQRDTYYGRAKSFFLRVNDADVDASQIVVCDLSDAHGAWAHEPALGKIAIDPALGRIAFNASDAAPSSVNVSYHYGFSAEMGGGEYPRADSFDETLPVTQTVSRGDSIQNALDALTESGAVEIGASARYAETLSLHVPVNTNIELRAANHTRPHLALGGDMTIQGDARAQVTLNGLLISGGALHVTGNFSTLRLRHCTLVPGHSLDVNGAPVSPDAVSLVVDAPNATIEIDHCIVGALRAADSARVVITNSIVDATDETRVAFAALDGESAGAAVTLKNSTLIGKVHTREIELASNTIFLARLTSNEAWSAPVISARKQAGCVRFSYVPFFSQTPRRYRCQPTQPSDEARVRPQFNSLRYGDAAYCQLSQRAAPEIRAGAEDDAEMGAFHDLYQPQRESNLRTRLDEYLRFGLTAGIFYET